MLPKFLAVAGLALAPLVSFAQSTPHLYVGVGASLLSSNPFQSYRVNTVGPAGTLGVQLSPRWALQSGAFLAWRSSTEMGSAYVGSGTFSPYSSSYRTTLLSVPVLARYTFTAPSARFHVDALFGATWLHSGSRVTTSYTSGTGSITSYDSNYYYNGASLGVGPAVRYTLGTSLDIVASSLVQNELTGNGSFSDRLFLTTQLGVQYAFGRARID